MDSQPEPSHRVTVTLHYWVPHILALMLYMTSYSSGDNSDFLYPEMKFLRENGLGTRSTFQCRLYSSLDMPHCDDIPV